MNAPPVGTFDAAFAAHGIFAGMVVCPPDVAAATCTPLSPIVARSSDRAGMERFFGEIGVTYAPRLEFKDKYARETAIRAAARFDIICEQYARFPDPSGTGKKLHAARSGDLGRHREEYPVASVRICHINDETGYGCFAAGDIAKGQLLGEYTGILSGRGCTGTDGIYHMRPNPWEMMPIMGEAVAWTARTIVCAEKAGNEMRFVNHVSEDMVIGGTSMRAVNVDVRHIYTFNYLDEGHVRDPRQFWNLFHILFMASRDIAAGEELRFDYGEAYWAHFKKTPDDSCVYRLKDDKLVRVPVGSKK